MKFKSMYFTDSDYAIKYASQYNGKFISRKLNNGDFDYWLVLEIINWHESTGDNGSPKYCIEITAVSPQEAGQEAVDRAISSCGFSDDQEITEMIKIEALSDYGIAAHLWNKSGSNLYTLLKEARKEADLIHGLFGFYMDRPENAMGTTGWHFIKGVL